MTDKPAAELWCVNVQGPDDVFATASREEAIDLAHRFNTWWIETVSAKGLDPYEPTMWGVPCHWPKNSESHAASLAWKNGDYAWLRSLPTAYAK